MPVNDLAPLKGLTALQSLYCSGTEVSDLAPLKGLDNLQELNASGCRLTTSLEEIIALPSLKRLIVSHLPHTPAEVLSQDEYENCLDSLHAHYDDLAAGS